MRIGTTVEYSSGFTDLLPHLTELESVGVEVLAVPEAYSFDAVSQLGFLAARTERLELMSSIFQLYTRTPALTAMTAAGLDFVSGGRFTLGLGASGPQVIEGFHGVPYDHPLGRTREIVDICRAVWRRERLRHLGPRYPVPLPAGTGTGLGKPIALLDHPVRERIPIALAALGPRNVALAAEIAEVWQPLFLAPAHVEAVWGQALRDGAARRAPDLAPLQVVLQVPLSRGEPSAEVWHALRHHIALYVGGMGARGKNFYHQLACRYGYEKQADEVQDAYLGGAKDKAAELVPEELIRAVCLIGEDNELRDQLRAMADVGVTTLLVSPVGRRGGDRVADLAQVVALARELKSA